MWNKILNNDDGFCLKQTNTYQCLIFVAAMATGTKPQEVIEFIGTDGFEEKGASVPQIYKFLIHHNIFPGFLESIGDIQKYNGSLSISLSIDIEQFPAIVYIKSKLYPETPHAIYWNKKEVLDPDPNFSGDLEDYEILSWLPLVRIND